MKKSELPAKIEGIREMVAKWLYLAESDLSDGISTWQKWDKLPQWVRDLYLQNATELLSKLTEHGARIKINGKWYGLDGTVKEG